MSYPPRKCVRNRNLPILENLNKTAEFTLTDCENIIGHGLSTFLQVGDRYKPAYPVLNRRSNNLIRPKSGHFPSFFFSCDTAPARAS